MLRAAARAREKLREIQLMFAAIRGELQGDRFWRYQRQVSPGLQEYIEALSFTHYLETGTLVSFEEVQKTLSDEHGVAVRAHSSVSDGVLTALAMFSISPFLWKNISSVSPTLQEN